MRILILVLSCLEPPFGEVMKVQQETWDSIDVEGVSSIYYHNDNKGFKSINSHIREFGTNVVLDYDMLHWKFFLTLQEIIEEDWDYIFRTNSSSYVDKVRLLEFAKSLPKTQCYSGINGGGFASGSGFFISKDVARILLETIEQNRTPFEDVYIGQILSQHGIDVTPGALRYDFYARDVGQINEKCYYHFRCKRNETSKDEYINAMKFLFENLKN